MPVQLTGAVTLAAHQTVLAFFAYLAFSTTLQYLGGAYQADFSGYPDEPAHYVTGLLVRDWILSGLPWPATAYAETYYLHYPKVALGQWPPGFYVVQAAWTLAFSTSRASIMLLMSVLMSSLALVMSRALAEEYGWKAGLPAGLLLVAVPLNQTWTQMVMADVAVALLTFCATLAFGRYLDSGQARHAGTFGLIAALAILTKGNAVALALVPLIAVVLSRRLALVRRPSFWLPLIIVIALCGPWYVLTAHGVINTFAHAPGMQYSTTAVAFYGSVCAQALGVALLPVIAVGFVARVVLPIRRYTISGRWAAVSALLLANWIFLSVVSAGYEPRYLIPVTPVLVMALVAGTVRLGLTDGRPLPSLRLVAVILAVGLVFIFETFHIPKKTGAGFMQVAADIARQSDMKHSVVLVSSESDGEGLLISEIAMREPRPDRFVLRATKALARVDWNATTQEPYYSTPAEVMRYLDEVPVDVLVLDLSPGRVTYRHHRLLTKALTEFPTRFEPLRTYRSRRDAATEIRVYRILRHDSPALDKVNIDRERLLTRWNFWRGGLAPGSGS